MESILLHIGLMCFQQHDVLLHQKWRKWKHSFKNTACGIFLFLTLLQTVQSQGADHSVSILSRMITTCGPSFSVRNLKWAFSKAQYCSDLTVQGVTDRKIKNSLKVTAVCYARQVCPKILKVMRQLYEKSTTFWRHKSSAWMCRQQDSFNFEVWQIPCLHCLQCKRNCKRKKKILEASSCLQQGFKRPFLKGWKNLLMLG